MTGPSSKSFLISSPVTDISLPDDYAGKRYSIVLVDREDEKEMVWHTSAFFNPMASYALAIRNELIKKQSKKYDRIIIYEEVGLKPYVKRIGVVYYSII